MRLPLSWRRTQQLGSIQRGIISEGRAGRPPSQTLKSGERASERASERAIILILTTPLFCCCCSDHTSVLLLLPPPPPPPPPPLACSTVSEHVAIFRESVSCDREDYISHYRPEDSRLSGRGNTVSTTGWSPEVNQLNVVMPPETTAAKVNDARQARGNG